jgi:excisionase family DNA binding protein
MPYETTCPATVLTLRDVRVELRVSAPTVLNLIRSGALRSYSLGRRRFVSRDALLDFIAAREVAEPARPILAERSAATARAARTRWDRQRGRAAGEQS